jgi:hypothetical protein
MDEGMVTKKIIEAFEHIASAVDKKNAGDKLYGLEGEGQVSSVNAAWKLCY